ncbi:MAG TPA: tetratricopeptide repeat protein [Candidatus Polarisedimenticolia bacterium]|nr:tetratricopeptide repeat protein [Candidatus Polarisedimenticolia bacterium]
MVRPVSSGPPPRPAPGAAAPGAALGSTLLLGALLVTVGLAAACGGAPSEESPAGAAGGAPKDAGGAEMPAAHPGAEAPAAPSLATGMALFRHGDFKGAEPHLVGALAAAPGDHRILEALGAIYARTDRPRKAEETFRAALAIDAASVGARLGLAAVLIDTGRYDEAQATLDEVRRRDPANVVALQKWALLEARRGRSEEAEKGARAALERQPASAEAHYVLGLALAQRGLLDEAAAALRRAQEIAPGHLGALSNLVKVEMRRGRKDEALRLRRLYEEALARQRIEEKVRGHRLKGVEAFNRDDYATALVEFQAIARDDPNDPQVHLHLGSTLIALRRLPEARSELDRSLALDPRGDRALTELGRLNALTNNLDEAVSALERAIALNPENAEPHYYLAGVRMARGQPALYQEEMRKFNELRSRSQGAATEIVPSPPGQEER